MGEPCVVLGKVTTKQRQGRIKLCKKVTILNRLLLLDQWSGDNLSFRDRAEPGHGDGGRPDKQTWEIVCQHLAAFWTSDRGNCVEDSKKCLLFCFSIWIKTINYPELMTSH